MGGHAEDMIGRYKNNAILRKRYRERHERMYDALKTEFSNYHLEGKDIPKAERERIKAKIRTTIKRERRLAFIKSLLLSIVVVALIIYFLMSTVFAQGIVSEDNRWNVYATGYPSYIGTETYKIEGDSIYNSHGYKKIWLTRDSVDATWEFQGLLREDSNVVYYISPGYEEGVLYDFNAEVGDTVMIINMFCPDIEIQAVIFNIDSTEYFGVVRKRWFINDEYSIDDYWIEGIGSNFGPLHSMYYMCIVCPTWDLLCFHKNDTLMYQMFGYGRCYYSSVGIEENVAESDIIIYPNPVKDKSEIRSAKFEIELVEVFDLRGKKVINKNFNQTRGRVEIDVSLLASGMYICRIHIGEEIVSRKFIKE